MASDRSARFALNEVVFRTANERMSAWPERSDPEEIERFYCECARPECREQLQLTGAQYEAVRADSRLFVLLPGHEILDVEHVIGREEGHVVVEKESDLTELLRLTDPRR